MASSALSAVSAAACNHVLIHKYSFAVGDVNLWLVVAQLLIVGTNDVTGVNNDSLSLRSEKISTKLRERYCRYIGVRGPAGTCLVVLIFNTLL